MLLVHHVLTVIDDKVKWDVATKMICTHKVVQLVIRVLMEAGAEADAFEPRASRCHQVHKVFKVGDLKINRLTMHIFLKHLMV